MVLPLLGGLDKLADIISPAAEDTPVQQAALNSLQRGLKGVQAALEDRQGKLFGQEVSHHSTGAAYCFQLVLVHMFASRMWY